MAKYCYICGNKIGFLDQSLKLKDKKYICGKEIEKYGFSKKAGDTAPTSKAFDWAFEHTSDDLNQLIQSGKTFKDILAKKEADVAVTNFKSPSDSSVIKKAADKINKLRIPKEIKKQLIDAEVFDFWFNNKELKELPNIVEYKNGEVIKYAANGLKEINGSTRTVLILCTNRRVIFLNKNMIFGGDSTDIPLNMINSVQLTTHLVLADISIINGSTTTVLKNLNKDAAKILSKIIKQQMLEFQKKMYQPQVVSAENSKPDPADEIRKFKKLADDGIITQDEFEVKKKQLLGL